MSKVQMLCHIIISTYHRQMTIDSAHEDDLYRYIWKFLNERDCILHQIGGIGNHIHLLVNINPSISVSDLVKGLKQASNLWIKSSGLFPMFDRWGREYASFSCSYSSKDRVISYIKNQKMHHLKKSFQEELEEIFSKCDLDFHENDLS